MRLGRGERDRGKFLNNPRVENSSQRRLETSQFVVGIKYNAAEQLLAGYPAHHEYPETTQTEFTAPFERGNGGVLAT